MTKLEKKLRTSLKKLGIDATASIVVAASGGPDSTALLDAIVRSPKRSKPPETIVVAHLNHLLRGEESDRDEEFVAQLAAQSGLSCFIERIDVADQARHEKKNVEATARKIRYDFLRRVAERTASRAVLTGHTQDDQVETILMRLLRGSGAGGFRGIHRVRQLSEKVELIRPLLDVTREEVMAHCEHYRLPFRVDSTNLSADLTRNRVRCELLPLLRSFNPRCDAAIARAADLLADDENYLQQVSNELYQKAAQGDEIEIGPLRQSHRAVGRRALRIWLREVRGDLRRIDAGHLEAIENLIIAGRSGSGVEIPGGRRIVREFERLVLTQTKTDVTKEPGSILLSEWTNVEFGGFCFSLRRNVPRESLKRAKDRGSGEFWALIRECNALDDLRLRTRRPGDAYTPQGRSRKIKLKSLMIRHKIPLSQRHTYPVATTAEDQIIWSPGLPVARQFAPSEVDVEETKCALIVAKRKS